MRRCQRDCQEFISVDGVDQDVSGCWTQGLFPPVIVSGGPRTRSPGRRHMARVGPVYEMAVSRPQPGWHPTLAYVGKRCATRRELLQPKGVSGQLPDG